MDDALSFHVPPECRGQIVEVAYAATADGNVIRRACDASDRSSSYAIARQRDDDRSDYWNGAPAGYNWRELTPAEMERYGLD